jgi:hypothetical protein
MGAPKDGDGDRYRDDEAQERFERLVRSALKTKPKPLKDMRAKGMSPQSKKTHKRRNSAA